MGRRTPLELFASAEALCPLLVDNLIVTLDSRFLSLICKLLVVVQLKFILTDRIFLSFQANGTACTWGKRLHKQN